MRLLIDTHALIWWLGGDHQLSDPARGAIADAGNEIFVSAASAFEIATKFRLGKLPGAQLLAQDFESIVAAQDMQPLPITLRHGRLAGSLDRAHKDPFDRMLIAQALIENLTFVSNEAPFDAYGVVRLW